MYKRNWKTYRANSLQDAIEGCVEFARDRKQMSVDRIADAMGLASKWTLYKWIENAAIPARMVRPFENACGAVFVTQYLAASAHKLIIDIPTGRAATADDTQVTQSACNSAIGALLDFTAGRLDAPATIAAITDAIERLARERAEVERAAQPELSLS